MKELLFFGIVALILSGLLLWGIPTLIRRRFGRLEAVRIALNTRQGGRTPGEINRELWEQKGALDHAVEVTAKATVQNNARKLAEAQATPVRGWHAPDAPCEVEP